jgi:hypothetical protein
MIFFKIANYPQILACTRNVHVAECVEERTVGFEYLALAVVLWEWNVANDR